MLMEHVHVSVNADTKNKYHPANVSVYFYLKLNPDLRMLNYDHGNAKKKV